VAIRGNPTNAQVLAEEVLALRVIVINIARDASPLAGMRSSADRLHADLQSKRVRCWFAPHDVQGGRKLHEQIDEAIRLHDKLLLILSPHSMESEWVKTEIAKARKREVRDQRRVLFPIRLAPFETLRDWECFDADTGKDSAREIREYFIPDFSNWKDHDSYQEAFQRLIDDLKSPDSPSSSKLK
jgi:hypothetical protein